MATDTNFSNKEYEAHATGELSSADRLRAKGKSKSDPAQSLHVVLIMIPVTLAYFLVMLDNSVITTAVPSITSHFNSLLDIGWYGSAYQLASSAFVPMSGKIYTHFSTKWSFLTFFLIFELGSVLCGAATSSTMLIVGRGIAGLSASGLLNGALTIIACIMSPHKQASAMGINMGLGQVGVAIGPLIGGALTENVSWRWSFYINLPIGAVVVGMLLFARIPEVRPKRPVREVLGSFFHLFDIVGFLFIAPSAITLLLALQYGGKNFPWNSSEIIGLFVGSGLACITFLVWEWNRGDEAMVPLSMLSKRIVWCASFTMFFISGVLYTGNYFLPIYFQGVKGNSAIMSAIHMLPSALGQAIFATLAGTLIHAMGFYLPSVLTGTSFTAIGYGLLSTLQPDTSVHKWLGYQVLYGVGIGSAFSTSFIAIQNLIPAAQIPVAMAIVIFTQYLGGATCLSTAEAIFNNVLGKQIRKDVPGADAEAIVHAGATAFRQLVTPEQLPAVLKAFCTALDKIFYFGIGISVAGFLFSSGLGWKDIRIEHKITTQENSGGASNETATREMAESSK